MEEPSPTYPRIFISYSHDSPEHASRVLQLSDRLRADGIDAIVDQYELSPPEGWPRWTDAQIRRSDFVVMICTETYSHRVMGEEVSGTGLGVRWEANLIYQHLYSNDVLNTKFIPVLFDNDEYRHIPAPMRAFAFYVVNTETGYKNCIAV